MSTLKSGLRDKRRRQRCTAEWLSEAASGHRESIGQNPENIASRRGQGERKGRSVGGIITIELLIFYILSLIIIIG